MRLAIAEQSSGEFGSIKIGADVEMVKIVCVSFNNTEVVVVE